MPARLTKVLGAVALVVGVGALASPAAAAPGSGGGGGGGGSEGGVITATVTLREGGRSSGGSSDCTWERVDGAIGIPSMGVAEYPFVENGITYILYRKSCRSGDGGWYLLPQTEPRDLLPSLLRQLRERSLPRPSPVFEMLDPVNHWAFVTVPVDFRAGGDSWRTVSATASIGPVWATVTAQPTTLTFDPGDPAGSGPVSCAGDAPVAAYVAATPGDCSYTYTNASSTSTFDGYHFLTTLTIEWAISWTSSSGGGTLEPYSTSATAPLAVAEVKGLVSCTGSRGGQGGC